MPLLYQQCKKRELQGIITMKEPTPPMKKKILTRLRKAVAAMFTGEGKAFPPQNSGSLQDSISVDRTTAGAARGNDEPPPLPCNFYSEF